MQKELIRYIYFDLDDTLLNHKKAEQNGLKDIYNRIPALQVTSVDELLEVYARINRGLWIEYAQGTIDRSTLHRRRFQESFEALGIDGEIYEYAGSIYMECYSTHWEWIKGAKYAFSKLQEHYKMGVITNGFAETQWMKIRQFEFDKLCSAIIISEEFGSMKPDLAIFNEATQQAGYTPDHILYVGDSLSSDVDGALNAGWNIAWYNPKSLSPEGRKPHLNFQDFQELIDVLV